MQVREGIEPIASARTRRNLLLARKNELSVTDGKVRENFLLVTDGNCGKMQQEVSLEWRKSSKGTLIRATFFANLSRNIVALQVETLCCTYYRVFDQLVSQQNSVASLKNSTRIVGQSCVIEEGSFCHAI